jgi:DNA repair exonuclease SbcCD ATPase subunit
VGVGPLTVLPARVGDNADDGIVSERELLVCFHRLLSSLAARERTIHDLAMPTSRRIVDTPSRDGGGAGVASPGAALADGSSRAVRQLEQERAARRTDAEDAARRVREVEERCKQQAAQLAELRQKLFHSEHRVKQREAELDAMRERLRKTHRCGGRRGGRVVDETLGSNGASCSMTFPA